MALDAVVMDSAAEPSPLDALFSYECPDGFQPEGYESVWEFYIKEIVQSPGADGKNHGIAKGLDGFDFNGLDKKLKSWDYNSRETLLEYVSDDVLNYKSELLDNPAGYERLKQLAETILNGSSFRTALEKSPEELKAEIEEGMARDYDGMAGF